MSDLLGAAAHRRGFARITKHRHRRFTSAPPGAAHDNAVRTDDGVKNNPRRSVTATEPTGVAGSGMTMMQSWAFQLPHPVYDRHVTQARPGRDWFAVVRIACANC
jgi:hypothetical protein